ncbi:molybdopterin-dependent oxidoreductase [candidate division KSB3 bacterium]|uniref:Molybdopterin-dependent oxidoreductase n=1 Tax=candidate division KSB3 bacterium TaxID=2044937 RepID=A0A9D5K0G6_9BACT|nr:molybdopterin-dependent oxidoreductase [candidate division KSB3 bacterium]MBD3327380.1 molybdopterin-dependent oxidoreductase [candidate division KSB3 bacterium]
MSTTVVNKSLPKVDGIQLVTGSAKYTDDFDLPGLLHAKVLTSPHPHARIKHIQIDRASELPGVHAVLTHQNLPLPQLRHTRAGQSYPEPSPYDHVILDEKVRFVGDRVAVVAAESLRIAEQALQLIEVEYELLPAVFDMQQAMNPGAPIIHDEADATGIYDASRNIAAYSQISLGDVEQGFQEADLIIENTYSTQRAKHCALETHGSLAYLDENDCLVVISSTQVPFHTRRQLAYILHMPMSRIRVIKPRMGGGFGNKQGMFLEDLVALLALQTRRPVKLIFDRAEEFRGGYTRHPQRIRLKTGAKRDGTLVAQEMHVLGNTGAYGDHAPTVQECTGRKVLPLYRVPHVQFEYHAVYTNLPVSGAFRGYGAIQGFFAIESQIDEIAHRLHLNPLEVRQKNRIREGDVDLIAEAFGDRDQRVILSCGLGECIERGARAIGWQAKRGIVRHGVIKRGAGMACAMQGSGIAGVDWGSATITLNEDGTFSLFVGATDLGTGADTVLTQIAAESLGVGLEEITIVSSDTDVSPFDVGAYASSTTYVSGNAVKNAAELIRAEILRIAANMLDVPLENVRYQPKETPTSTCQILAQNGKRVALRDVAMYAVYQEKTQITKTASSQSRISPPPFTAQFAEVEVDTETGQVKVLKFVAAVDCGVAINPALAEGQVEGAVTQGLGFALFEKMAFDDQGRILNPNFADYKLFNAFDMPPLETILVQTYESTGPYGAKSVAEVPINCPAPAIANAIYDAIGVRMYDLPITAEKVLAALKTSARPKTS